ncbi:MAG: UvrD-helicase domain-containing protein [Candidatus Magasanikbacteria bacterium]|nr:UvrD-helicase domain-containing protein [Candidatus Magasanikbacteria bacterium]MBT4072035.1 UvrD-helicase domain-containing protein [Candidatus Magasanikbacteria bacterium]
MPNYSQELNPEQLAVVEHGDGPCLVLAGAGSGKTRTITYRVAYLLEQGVKPEEILLVTFTNKAAREMIFRVQQLVGSQLYLPWAGTFHHIAYKMLKKYAPLLGYESNFSILDSEDSRNVIKLCLKEKGLDKKIKKFPSARVVQGIISFTRNCGKPLEDVIEDQYPQWLQHIDMLGSIAKDYSQRKKEANAMDFDDMLVRLFELLSQNPRVRELFAQQFRYVLVDEYQDTNAIQSAIVGLFSSVHKNILVVGDDAQSIYSFRAADIEHILAFEKHYPSARVFRLEVNYRSTPDILSLANDVIAKNTNQYKKELRSIIDPHVKPTLRVCAEQAEEAEFIVDEILALEEEGVSFDKMAVLFRAAFHSQALEMELVKRDIPYEYRGGVRFFERAHIKDVLAYVRIFVNKTDTIAWSRVLHMQVGIGPATALRIISSIQSAGEIPLADIELGLSARPAMGWQEVLQIWEAMEKSDKTATGLIGAVADSRYEEYLMSQFPDYRDRMQDIEQLALFAGKAKDVSQFLAEATMQEQFRAAEQQSETKYEPKLVLSTIHQAKGLEWHAVFVMHMAQGQFPNERALKQTKGLEEERRLFYVAVTRAKKNLFLSYPIVAGYKMLMGGPSMFLQEIDQDLFEEQRGNNDMDYSHLSDADDGVVYESLDNGWSSPKKRPTSFLMDV